MSKFSDFKERVQSLEEIKEIISAMKNLSILEINRVSRYLSHQKKIVEMIETSAKDFFSFYHVSSPLFSKEKPEHGGQSEKKGEVYIAIGSERGFCGGFNDSVANAVLEMGESAPIIAIGRKLHDRLEDYIGEKELIDGAESIEEIDSVLSRLIHILAKFAGFKWVLIYNEEIESRFVLRTIRPYELIARVGRVDYPAPPLINGDPGQTFIQLLDQYVFALLYSAFFISYMAENRQRLNHMDGVESRIKKRLDRYYVKLNNLRQEDITEEIEVILLNLDGFGEDNPQ